MIQKSAFTCTFLRLGKNTSKDSLFYTYVFFPGYVKNINIFAFSEYRKEQHRTEANNVSPFQY